MRGQATVSLIKALIGWGVTTAVFIFLADVMYEIIDWGVATVPAASNVLYFIKGIWDISPLLIILFWGLWAVNNSQKTEFDSAILP